MGPFHAVDWTLASEPARCQPIENDSRNSKFDFPHPLPEVDMSATWPNVGKNVAVEPRNRRSSGRNWHEIADLIEVSTRVSVGRQSRFSNLEFLE